jgi:predicted DNA-binding transcriptional regulator AlpA
MGKSDATIANGNIERLTVRIPEAAQMLSISRAALYRLLW